MNPTFKSNITNEKYRNTPSPTPSNSNYTDVSSVSEFSESTFVSAFTARSREKPLLDRPVNSRCGDKFSFPSPPEVPHFVNIKPEIEFPENPESLFNLHPRPDPDIKFKRSFSPPSPFPLPSNSQILSDLRSKPFFSSSEMPSLVSAPVPPLFTSSVPIKSSPGPSGMNFSARPPYSQFFSARPPYSQFRNLKIKKKNRPFRSPVFLPVAKKQAVFSGIETAVLDDSPGGTLSDQKAELIQAELVKALDRNQDEFQPHFLKSFFDQGVLWMICANERTKLWLTENIQRLNQRWKDLNLKVVNARIPKRPVLYVDLMELDKTPEVLDRLRSQNRDLNTSKWVVLNRKVYRTGQRIAFSVDLDSFEFLKARKFQLAWKLDTLTFKVPSKGTKKGNKIFFKRSP